MVLCKYFQQGTCRFGSKCHNEHFDVRQVIKTDVESAINGKQWPLSTYGPFKDKPSIPNFIEDQLFEEVRLLCYEAKKKNVFEQFHQHFTKEAVVANNKMKALLQMTPEIVDVVINCYDAPTVGSNTDGQSSHTNSSFGISVCSVSSADSIFAKPQPAKATNVFGSGVQTNFGTSTNNVMGVFGGGKNYPQMSSIFGGSYGVNQVQQQGSIFSQAAKNPNAIFGCNANIQQPPTIFGQQQPSSVITGNLFSQAQQQSHLSKGFNMFSQQHTQQQSLFNPAQQSGNIFGQPQSTNIFTQSTALQPQQLGIFVHSAAALQPSNNQAVFGKVSMQQNIQSNQGCLFARGGSDEAQDVFSQSIQQQYLPKNAQINTFEQFDINFQPGQEQPSPPSGNNQTALQTETVASPVFSRMEDLKLEEIEAFKADGFLPGKLPCNPPPRQFVT